MGGCSEQQQQKKHANKKKKHLLQHTRQPPWSYIFLQEQFGGHSF